MDIEERVNIHDIKMARIETMLDSIAHSMDKISSSIDKQQQALTRLAQIEENTKGSIERIHDRIDAAHERINRLEAKCEKQKDDITPLLMLIKYPKVMVFLLIGAYVMLIPEVRKVLFG
jgi:chromosome segregation ATPase